MVKETPVLQPTNTKATRAQCPPPSQGSDPAADLGLLPIVRSTIAMIALIFHVASSSHYTNAAKIRRAFA